MYKTESGKELDPERDKRLASLLTKAQQGDQVAYEEFLLETTKVLRRYLGKRTQSDMVEDLLQDTLLSVHRFLHTYLPGKPVGPWVYAICSNRIVDFYRRKRRIQRIEADVDIEDQMVAGIEHVDPSLNSNAFEALKQLPERQRRIIELLKLYGLSVKEVSAHTGMSESLVKTTAFRGYETIRKLFGIKG
jgi:RNA polymerase sigma-70 factor (ECF subfamily)